MALKDDIQMLDQFTVLYFLCVERKQGSEIRGATKSFLAPTHCATCLSNMVPFFVPAVSDLCVSMKQRAGRGREQAN